MATAMMPALGRPVVRRTARMVAPITPVDVLDRRKVAIIVGTVLVLATAARIDGGRVLLEVDGPVQRFVESNRSDTLDRAFRTASFLGSTWFVLVGGAVLALVAALRCRATALLVVAATLARPPIEWLIKELVGRDRPDLTRMVRGTGPSFPSGHVLAAAALWCMVPVVVSLYSRSVRLWWAAVWVAVGAVAVIGASRVYLGVHWTVDVIAGFAVASLLLLTLDLLERRAHARLGRSAGDPAEAAAAAPL